MRPRLLIATLLFVVSAVFQACFITLDAIPSDEGLVLVAADDVARGRLLYRDCYVPVTPEAYLLQGLAFKLFGSSFLVSRILMCMVYATCVALTFAIAACCLPLRHASVAGALTIPLQVWMWPHAQFFSYNAVSILFCVLAIRIAWSIEAGPHRRRNAFALGAALAAGLWAKPNLAAATGAGVLLYWLSGWLRALVKLPAMRARGLIDCLSEGLVTLAGMAALSLPLVAYLAATGTLDDLAYSLYALGRIYGDAPTGFFPGLFPLTEQIDAVRLNAGLVLPGMLWAAFWRDPAFHYLLDYTGWVDLVVRLFYYIPVALFLAAALCLGRRLWQRSWSIEDEAALLTCLAGLALFLTIVPHPAFHYMTPTLLPLVVLTVFLGSGAATGSAPTKRWLVRSIAVGAGSVYLASSLGALFLYLSIPREPVHSARGTVWTDNLNARLWNQILDYARTELSNRDRVFVVPYFPLFYFLTGREHPTRFIDLRPGSPGREAEDEIMSQLDREGVDFVLNLTGGQYPGIERFENAYPRLHRYIMIRFEVDREFRTPLGLYAEIRRRKGKIDSSNDQPQ